MGNTLPPITVTRPFLPPFEEYVGEIKKIWDTNWLTNNGPIHQEFEALTKEYLGVPNISLYTNGHLALEIALKSLDIQGEVITTPFTFASTTHAIVNSGLTPVFCDIKLDDYTIDPESVEKLITPKTAAIVAVHVFGTPCDVQAINYLSKKHGLKVIYDAAHAFGVKIGEQGIGAFGDISMFSLHATKVFHSIEGGVLAYSDASLKKKLESFKNFGMSGGEDAEVVGTNAKMNEFQACMGIVNLRHIEQEIMNRGKVADCYREHLNDVPGIQMLNQLHYYKQNYSYFPILIDETKFGMTRDQLHCELQQYNIFTRKYFYPLTTEFQCYRGNFDDTIIKNGKYVAQRILTLPMYGQLTQEQVLKICAAIKSIHSNSKGC